MLIANNRSILTGANCSKKPEQPWCLFAFVAFPDEFLNDLRVDHFFQDNIVFVAQLCYEIVCANCIVVVCLEHMFEKQTNPLRRVHLIKPIVDYYFRQ